MGLSASSCACNALSSCLCNAFACCGRCVPCRGSVAVRAAYAVWFAVLAVAAWAMREWGPPLLTHAPGFAACWDGETVDLGCLGSNAVYRIVFGLTIFHFLMSLVTIGVRKRNDCRHAVQGGNIAWWFIKAALPLGFTLASFWFPNAFFSVYGFVYMGGALLFLLLQVVLLIEFAYALHEKWVDKYDETGHKRWAALLFTFVAILFAGTVALIGVQSAFFGTTPGCGVNVFFIAMNACLCVFVTIFSVIPAVQSWNPRSGLLQSSVVSVYCSYVIFSALSSEPSTWECSTLHSAVSGRATLIVGALITIISVCYSTVRSGSSSAVFSGMSTTPEGPVNMSSDDDDGDGDHRMRLEKRDESRAGIARAYYKMNYSYSFFHFVFAIGACYIGMLLTNWHVLDPTQSNQGQRVDAGIASTWLKVIVSWVTFLLYLWTLIAPRVLKRREFY